MVRLVILRLLESWFRRWWLYIIPVILMLAVGVLLVFRAPSTYTASATLFIEDNSLLLSLTNAPNPTERSWWQTPAEVVRNDYRELMQTEAFMRALIQNTNLETRAARSREDFFEALWYFRDSIQLHTPGNKLMIIMAETEDPDLSVQMVNSLINTYISWKLNVQYQESAAAQAFFAGQIPSFEQELQQARDALTVYLATYPEPVRGDRPLDEQIELQRLQAAVNDASRRLDEVRDNEESSRLVLMQAESVLRQTYQVLDAPGAPERQRMGRRAMLMQVVLAGAIGGVLCIVGVIGGAVLDRSLRFAVDVQQLLHLPTLAIVSQKDISSTVNDRERVGEQAEAETGARTSRPQALKTVPPAGSMPDRRG